MEKALLTWHVTKETLSLLWKNVKKQYMHGTVRINVMPCDVRKE